MAQSVRLFDDLNAFSQEEVELHNRALANQATHWASIGQVIARSGIYEGLHRPTLQERNRRVA